METKKLLPSWASALVLVLLFAALILNVATMTSITYIDAAKILDITACVLALAYCLVGYTKNAAMFFKIFCAVYCISCMLPIYLHASYTAGNDATFIINLTANILPFACLSIFTVALDLGKKKSLVMAWIVLVCSIVIFVANLIVGMNLSLVLGLTAKAFLAVVFLIMMYAKYRDKDARGTK